MELNIIQETTVANIIGALIEINFVKSKNDFTRLVNQNGVQLNGEKLNSEEMDRVLRNNDVMKIGKKRFVKFICK